MPCFTQFPKWKISSITNIIANQVLVQHQTVCTIRANDYDDISFLQKKKKKGISGTRNPWDREIYSRARVWLSCIQTLKISSWDWQEFRLLPPCSGPEFPRTHKTCNPRLYHPWGSCISWWPNYGLNFCFPYKAMSIKHLKFFFMHIKHS